MCYEVAVVMHPQSLKCPEQSSWAAPIMSPGSVMQLLRATKLQYRHNENLFAIFSSYHGLPIPDT